MRTHFTAANLIPEGDLAVRTRQGVSLLADALRTLRPGLGEEETAAIAEKVLIAATGASPDTAAPATREILFLDHRQVDRLAHLAAEGAHDITAYLKTKANVTAHESPRAPATSVAGRRHRPRGRAGARCAGPVHRRAARGGRRRCPGWPRIRLGHRKDAHCSTARREDSAHVLAVTGDDARPDVVGRFPAIGSAIWASRSATRRSWKRRLERAALRRSSRVRLSAVS